MNKKLIVGKEHDEIISMTNQNRYLWYKTISQKDKEKAMKMMKEIKCAKISKSHKGMIASEKTKIKMSKSKMGKKNHNFGKSPSEETRAKISMANTGENHPMYNKIPSKEHRINISNAWAPEKRAELSKIMMGENNPAKRPEVRAKISAGQIGDKNPNWQNGKSFEPYCYLFNGSKKEEVRNRWGRNCVLTDLMRSTLGSESGLDDFEGHEIFSKQRNSVHHVRGDKMEGCNGKEMALVPLQGKFNSKKFDGLKLEHHPFYITLFLFKDIERKYREEMLGFKFGVSSDEKI